MPISVNGANGITFADGSIQNTGAAGFGFKNRIINGAMVINQRGWSGNITTGNEYTLDRFQGVCSVSNKFSVSQSTSVYPSGLNYSLLATSTSAYTVGAAEQFLLRQNIEAYNTNDLAWGTASASTVTLSFRVYSSLTGTFGGAIFNSNGSRSYPFTYSIPTANTWTTISITIAGDTSGTWAGTNGVGITVSWGLGVGSTYSGTAGAWAGTYYPSATGATSVVGTSGATFYITGVQLEKGSTATAFDYRDFGRELALCQRYYEKSYDYGTAPGTSNALQQAIGLGIYTNTPAAYNRFGHVYFKVAKRAGPTVTLYAPATGSSATASNATSGDGGTNIGYCQAAQVNQYGFNIAASVGGSTNTNYYTAFFAFTAEAEL